MRLWGACALAIVTAACSQQQRDQQGDAVKDAYLASAVTAQLATVDVDSTTNVHVAAAGSTVTLTGKARTTTEAADYAAAARKIDGVTQVDNQLIVDTHLQGPREDATNAALAARISAAIASQAGVNAFTVKPSVRGGAVRLEGTVSSRSVQRTIDDAVRAVPGVTSVHDALTIGK